jgi:O-antigen ligase
MRPTLVRLGNGLPAVIALALPTVFVPQAVDSFILPRASIVIGGACLGAAVALLAGGGPGLGGMRWPLVAAAGAAAAAFIFSSWWPLSLAGAYTRYESLPVRLSYLGLFAAPVFLCSSRWSRVLVAPAFVIGTVVGCLWAVSQFATPVAFRPDGNLGNANLLGALCAMAAPIALAHALRASRFTPLWWAALPVLAVGLYVSTSRSGAIGALAGCAALGVLAQRGRTAALATLAAAALVAAGLAGIQLSPLRLLNDDPESLRLHLWHDAVRFIAARPLTGWGEDATGLAFGRYLSADWSPGVIFDRLHSGPLDLAATQGLIGVAALGWVLFVFLRGSWRARFAPGVAPLAAACVGYTAWVMFNFDWAPATGAFWLLAGTAWAAVRAQEAGAHAPSAPVESAGATPAAVPAGWRSGLAVTLGLATIWFAVLPVLADIWYAQGRADLAVRADPLQARYHWSFGQALIAQGSPAEGVAEMRRAADLGETEPDLYVELGDQEKQLGRTAQAVSDYRRALQIDPFYAPALQRIAAS